jgi:hypothetical protein
MIFTSFFIFISSDLSEELDLLPTDLYDFNGLDHHDAEEFGQVENQASFDECKKDHPQKNS